MLEGPRANSADVPATRRTEVFMDTPVTIEVVSSVPGRDLAADIRVAFSWFAEVERRCSRFDPASELMQICARPGVPVTASPLLFAAIRFAVEMAEATGGAFEPTVGDEMVRRGFNRNFRSGAAIDLAPPLSGNPSHRDIVLDPDNSRVTLRGPLTLDLGAVAKGFAIDLAARTLADYPGFAINAGGDIFAAGHSSSGGAWNIGIRHPRQLGAIVDSVAVSGSAVCTSGDYERQAATTGDSHILDPSTGNPAGLVASATVVAPTAMVADAFATAVFVLGPERGISLLKRNRLDGLIITLSLDSFETPGFGSYRQ